MKPFTIKRIITRRKRKYTKSAIRQRLTKIYNKNIVKHAVNSLSIRTMRSFFRKSFDIKRKKKKINENLCDNSKLFQHQINLFSIKHSITLSMLDATVFT